MIFGIGNDIVGIARLTQSWQRYGERFSRKILSASEQDELLNLQVKYQYGAEQIGRYLAKHFAAKEAFSKALGSGLRSPSTLSAISVVHDILGKPELSYTPKLQAYLNSQAKLLQAKRIHAHLSISDEHDYATAFVLLEAI